jgi:acyl carrier protein
VKPSLSKIRKIVIDTISATLKERGQAVPILTGATLLSTNLGLTSIDTLQIMAGLNMQLQTKPPYEKLLTATGEHPSDITVDGLAAFIEEHFDDPAPDLTAM